MIQLKDLVTSSLVSFPLKIKALSHDIDCSALIDEKGLFSLEGKAFDNLDTAMKVVLQNEKKMSSGNGWQFWGWYCEERQAWTPLEHLRAQISTESNGQVKTSQTHPLRINALTIPKFTGKVGLTFCPGKKSKGIYSGIWKRDLNSDLSTIAKWNTSYLLSLIEDFEFDLLKVPNFSQQVKQYPFSWKHLPIPDMSLPDQRFESAWPTLAPSLHSCLKEGGNIVIHCRGGLGRTGLVAARILVELGTPPDKAVDLVRQAREHSIETFEQESYILNKEWQ